MLVQVLRVCGTCWYKSKTKRRKKKTDLLFGLKYLRNAKMRAIVNAMPRYDHRQHVLSDWLAELDQRCQLGEVREDTNRITWCQLVIGTTGSSNLAILGENATWDDAKIALLSRLGIGSIKDEAWAAL